MESGNPHIGSFDFSQLTKYAEDFAEVYRSKKEKNNELQAVTEQLQKYANDMNKTVMELRVAHLELQNSFLDTIHRLVLAAEYKDEETGDHIIRMSRYSALIAEKLGLPAKRVKHILYAAPMHDVGKIGIPDTILLKPGKLTQEEFRIMKTHTIIGANILSYSKAEVLKVAEEIAISHHEKWNGEGYPQGLSGDKIPLVGRITSLADVFDALTSRRPYKDPYPVEMAIDIIRKERGRHFDPDMVDLILENMDNILKIKTEVNGTKGESPSNPIWSERDRGEGRTDFAPGSAD